MQNLTIVSKTRADVHLNSTLLFCFSVFKLEQNMTAFGRPAAASSVGMVGIKPTAAVTYCHI